MDSIRETRGRHFDYSSFYHHHHLSTNHPSSSLRRDLAHQHYTRNFLRHCIFFLPSKRHRSSPKILTLWTYRSQCCLSLYLPSPSGKARCVVSTSPLAPKPTRAPHFDAIQIFTHLPQHCTPEQEVVLRAWPRCYFHTCSCSWYTCTFWTDVPSSLYSSLCSLCPCTCMAIITSFMHVPVKSASGRFTTVASLDTYEAVIP